jgi:hypothetical protein
VSTAIGKPGRQLIGIPSESQNRWSVCGQLKPQDKLERIFGDPRVCRERRCSAGDHTLR